MVEFPSPKSHRQDATAPRDVSVNSAITGVPSPETSREKDAIGGGIGVGVGVAVGVGTGVAVGVGIGTVGGAEVGKGIDVGVGVAVGKGNEVCVGVGVTGVIGVKVGPVLAQAPSAKIEKTPMISQRHTADIAQ